MPRLMTVAAAGIALGAMLGGCSDDLYLARRDTIAASGGDAITANQVTQMVDPWPAQSGNPNIGFNGQRMQAGVQRYRLGKVTDAVDSQQLATTAQTQNTTQISIGGSTPATSTGSSATTATTTAGD